MVARRRSSEVAEAEVRLEFLRPALEAAYVQVKKDIKATPAIDPQPLMQPFLSFRKLPVRALRAAEEALGDCDFRERVAKGAAKSVGGPARLILDRPNFWEKSLGEFVEFEMAEMAASAEQVEQLQMRDALEKAEQSHGELSESIAQIIGERDDLLRQLEVERGYRAAAELAVSTAGEATSSSSLRISELSERATRAEQSLGVERQRVRQLEEELDAALEGARGLEKSLEASEKLASGVAVVVEDAGTVESGVEAPESLDRDRLAFAMASAAEAAAALARSLAEMAVVVEPPLVEMVAKPVSKTRKAPAKKSAAKRKRKRLPRAMLTESDEATEHLLSLAGIEVLIDGYNVTIGAWSHMDLPQQRSRLVRGLTSVVAVTKSSITVVFDGADGDWVPELPARCPIKVQFTAAGVEADDVILRRVAELPAATPVVVVSSDKRVAEGSRRLGAYVLTSDQLRRRLV